jgi:hypothetical protein
MLHALEEFARLAPLLALFAGEEPTEATIVAGDLGCACPASGLRG